MKSNVTYLAGIMALMIGSNALSEEFNTIGEGWAIGQTVKASNISEDYDDIEYGSGGSILLSSRLMDNFRLGGFMFSMGGSEKSTQMNLSGGGLAAEAFMTFAEVELSGGLQLGGAGARVTKENNSTGEDSVHEGKFTNTGGWFASPQVSAGYLIDRFRIYGFARSMRFLSSADNIRSLNNVQAGIGFASSH